MRTTMDADTLRMFQGMPIFGGLSDDTVRFLIEHARPVRIAAGGHFFDEGDLADSMFVLQAGRVAVSRRWKERLVPLRELGPGDCFGEMALMDFAPRSASVVAVDDCTALELATASLMALFERDAEQFALMQMNMGREVCRRLRATDALLFEAEMAAADTAQAPHPPAA